MCTEQIAQPTKITVIAIPVLPQDSHLKLVSVNQYKDFDTNGYKQFNISIEHEEYDNNSTHCLKDITNNINLNLITVLSLRNCALQSLPTILHLLPLKELDLQGNSLQHIPECIYIGLNCIENLNLSQNLISTFPLPNCYSSLKVLMLESCQFTNIPEWVLQMKCVHLEKFYYSKNKQRFLQRLDEPVVDVKINKLLFCNSQLTENKVEFFKSFKLLQYLDISNVGYENSNVIYDINRLVKNALWCNHIRVLKMNNLGISDLLEDFYKMPNLQELHISQNSVWNISEQIGAMKELVILDISNNCIYDLPHMAGLVNLRELRSSHNHLSQISVEHLPRLNYLDLYNNELQNVEFGTTIVELIDLDQNCVDPEVLSNVDNYAERRDTLRRGLSQLYEIGFCVSRNIGRKLGISEPESPSVVEVDDIEYYSSDISDEGIEFSCEVSVDVSKEDENGDDDDNCSDWGDSRSKNDLVTLSDSEFMPEDVSSNSNIVIPQTTRNMNVHIAFEHLFIDAD